MSLKKKYTVFIHPLPPTFITEIIIFVSPKNEIIHC